MKYLHISRGLTSLLCSTNRCRL